MQDSTIQRAVEKFEQAEIIERLFFSIPSVGDVEPFELLFDMDSIRKVYEKVHSSSAETGWGVHLTPQDENGRVYVVIFVLYSNGSLDKVTIPPTIISGHTHQKLIQKNWGCLYSWPSGDDMKVFLQLHLNVVTYCHVVFTTDGIYTLRCKPIFQQELRRHYLKTFLKAERKKRHKKFVREAGALAMEEFKHMHDERCSDAESMFFGTIQKWLAHANKWCLADVWRHPYADVSTGSRMVRKRKRRFSRNPPESQIYFTPVFDVDFFALRYKSNDSMVVHPESESCRNTHWGNLQANGKWNISSFAGRVSVTV